MSRAAVIFAVLILLVLILVVHVSYSRVRFSRIPVRDWSDVQEELKTGDIILARYDLPGVPRFVREILYDMDYLHAGVIFRDTTGEYGPINELYEISSRLKHLKNDSIKRTISKENGVNMYRLVDVLESYKKENDHVFIRSAMYYADPTTVIDYLAEHKKTLYGDAMRFAWSKLLHRVGLEDKAKKVYSEFAKNRVCSGVACELLRRLMVPLPPIYLCIPAELSTNYRYLDNYYHAEYEIETWNPSSE